MKKTAIILMVLATVGIANAVLVTNGGFNVNAADWNASGAGAWAPGHVATGGNPGGYLTLESGNSVWSCWYQVINESLAAWGIPSGTTITVKGDLIDLGTVGNNAVCGLKIESWNTVNIGEGASQFPVTNSWATYSFDYTIVSGATTVKLVVTNVNYNSLGTAKYGYDNISIGFPGGTPALKPVPIVGGTLPAANDVIRWTNPDPNNPADTITADVFILQSNTLLTKDPNLGPAILDPGVVQVANDITAQSLDLSNAGYTLTAGKYYYWAVHITDPEIGVVEGFDWRFLATDDAPPTNVSAGADKYVWLTMNDGTPLDGKVTFTLTGSYTDDGKSPVTKLWSLNPLTQTDPATVVTIATPTALSTNVTINNTGWFFFDFTATDAAGSVTDTVNVGVYVDACEAANADPTDIPTRYPNGNGDINGDCVINLEDFAILAETWIDCMSAKLGCTP